MRKWNDWKSHGVATAFQVVEGFRPMSIHNGDQFSGLRLYTQTPRVDINDVANPNDWTWVSHQGGLGAGSNTSPDGTPQMVFCCPWPWTNTFFVPLVQHMCLSMAMDKTKQNTCLLTNGSKR